MRPTKIVQIMILGCHRVWLFKDRAVCRNKKKCQFLSDRLKDSVSIEGSGESVFSDFVMLNVPM